uniref:CASP-like protein n=1 Tax=Zea mays TaxID=4577 RepID=A0A804MV38_MAIZE
MAAAIVLERALADASLVLRVVTLLLLTASLVIIVTNKVYGPFSDIQDPLDFTFRDVYAYRYVLSAAVIGCAYSLVVLPFAAIHVAQQGRKIGRGGARVLLIFTDAVFAVLVATGAAAGIGLTVDLLRLLTVDSDFKNFFNMAYLSCGLMLGQMCLQEGAPIKQYIDEFNKAVLDYQNVGSSMDNDHLVGQ